MSRATFMWFAAAAVLSGILGFTGVAKLNRLRTFYVLPVPDVAPNGQQIVDRHGRKVFKNVVGGPEADLRSNAADA